uniref:Centrosomal protein of 70 kDa n=1 Tax=Amphiprion percula TaxID=161767 RepID=A0A3P8SX94_AMPPE
MEQQEQVEWDDVNRLLQHHGFKRVFFADPVENKNHSDLVLLDKKSAGEVRMTLRTMLTDSERRQALIQELVKSNNQLKEEVQQHTSRAAQQSQRVTELEGLLDEVKTRVQDLEDRYLGKAAQQHSHTQQLQQEKQDAQKRCHVLEQKLSKQKEEAAQLQRKLYFTIKEEERRFARQSQTFQNICKIVSVQSNLNLGFPELYCSNSNKSGVEELKREVENLKKELETSIHADCFPALLTTSRHLVTVLSYLNKLSARLMPWQLCEGVHNAAEAVKVEDMMLLVDTMLETISTDDQKALRSPTPYTLGSMVSHFQKLFDITSLSGVYPRMNEVYTRLGEMTNAMKNLRDVLNLDSRVSPAEVVNQVSRLVSSVNQTVQCLIILWFSSIITKVKQHEEFFPAFHALVTEILQTLGVSHLDNILPALKDLKQTAQ